MSEQPYTPLDPVISNSQLDSHNDIFQTPSLLIESLKSQLSENLPFYEELKTLIMMVFPEDHRKNSMDRLMNDIANLEVDDKKMIDSSITTMNTINKGFTDKECAGFLLLIFSLKIDLQEMAIFIAREFPDLSRNFLASSKDLATSDDCKLIYQGLFDFYKNSEERIYKSLLEFIRRHSEIVIFKHIFFKMVVFTVKSIGNEMIDCLLIDISDYNAFLKNNRQVWPQTECFEKLVAKLMSDQPTRKHQLNEEAVLRKFVVKCLENKWEALFRLILRRRPQLLDDMKLFRAALANKHLRILRKFLRINQNAKEFLIKEENFGKVLDFLSVEESFIDGIFLLDQIKDQNLNIFYQRALIEKFEDLLRSTCKSEISLYRLLLSHVNPFSFCVVLSNIFHSLSIKGKELRLKFDLLASHFRSLALSLLERLEHNINLRLLLTKTFFPSEVPVLRLLLSREKFFEPILIKPNVYSILYEIWNSPYENTSNFLRFSTGYCLLTGRMAIFPEVDLNSSSSSFLMDRSATSSPVDSPKKVKSGSLGTLQSIMTFSNDGFVNNKNNLFKYMKTADSLNLKTNFNFQMKVFVKHMGFRYFIEFVSFFTAFVTVLTILMENLGIIFAVNEVPKYVVQALLNFVWLSNQNTDPLKLVSAMIAIFPQEQQGAFQTFLAASGSMDDAFTCKASMYIYYKTLDIEQNEFQKEVNECIPILTKFENYGNQRIGNIMKETILMITCFTGLLQVAHYCVQHRKFSFGFQHVVDLAILVFLLPLIYYHSIDNTTYFVGNFEDLLYNMKISLIALVLLVFVKIILFLRMTQTLGVPLRILFKMISHLTTIILMFIIIFCSFTIFMYFLYTTKDDHYTTIFKAFKTLFKFVFGEMVFYNGEDKTVDYSYFTVMTIGLGFIRVIFLNILIAILSNVYESVQKKSGLEIALMIASYNEFQNPKEKTMNSLVLLPSPFNVLAFILSPLIIFKRSKTLNATVLKFGYSSLLFCLTCLFLFSHMVILPLSWLLVLWRLLSNSYGEDYEISRVRFSVRLQHIMQWVVVGPFYLVYVIFRYDLPCFIRKGFEDIYQPSKNDQFTGEEYRILKLLIEVENIVFGIKKVKLENFRKKYRKVFESLRGYEEIRNEELKKNDLLVLMKNNFESLSINQEIDIMAIRCLLQTIKKMKIKKVDGRVVKYPQFLDIVSLKAVGDALKLFQFKNQLLK